MPTETSPGQKLLLIAFGLGLGLLGLAVHPDVEIHSLLAERLIDVLRAAGLVRSEALSETLLSETPGTSRRREIYDRVLAGLDRGGS